MLWYMYIIAPFASAILILFLVKVVDCTSPTQAEKGRIENKKPPEVTEEISPENNLCQNDKKPTDTEAKKQRQKSKSVAVVLAAFLGPFAWLYVFSKDNRWKFWLNLALCIITIFYWYAVAWIWAIIDLAIKPVSYYEDYRTKTTKDEEAKEQAKTISKSGRQSLKWRSEK